MKFLHTGDWHVGRTARGKSRDAEHAAALAQVLAHAKEQKVDCLLVAGDVFDSSSPSADSERVVYEFFRELHGLGVAAVVIAGNHDHPGRFDALGPLLRGLDIHLVGEPRPADAGGVIEMRSRDGRETAQVAALPWVTERRAVEFEALQKGPAEALTSYADRVVGMMDLLCRPLRRDAVSVLLGHALVDQAEVGPGGGERTLHMAWGIYGVQKQRLPTTAQYVALGHVHKPQRLRPSPPTWYAGSLLQLDFGEVEQDKKVLRVEVHPGQPADVTDLPITAGRRLMDVGSDKRGVPLDDLPNWAAAAGDAWLRVFVDLDQPVADLAKMVRDVLPNAVHVERVRPDAPERRPADPARQRSAEELFSDFYRSRLGRGREPSPETMALFRSLLEDATRATADA